MDFDNPDNSTIYSYSNVDWWITMDIGDSSRTHSDIGPYISLNYRLYLIEIYDDYILIDGNLKLTKTVPTPTAET